MNAGTRQGGVILWEGGALGHLPGAAGSELSHLPVRVGFPLPTRGVTPSSPLWEQSPV